MEEIRFTNLKTMIDSIKEHTQKNCSYVIPHEDSRRMMCGWYCEKIKTLFLISESSLQKSDCSVHRLALDSPLKRKIASIYLSNCSNDTEYQSLIEKINKLKAFW